MHQVAACESNLDPQPPCRFDEDIHLYNVFIVQVQFINPKPGAFAAISDIPAPGYPGVYEILPEGDIVNVVIIVIDDAE